MICRLSINIIEPLHILILKQVDLERKREIELDGSLMAISNKKKKSHKER